MNTNFSETEGKTFSYLEFGEISQDANSKEVYDFRTKSQAYDWLMHARYSHDIFTYLQMLRLLEKGDLKEVELLYKKGIYHADDFSSNLNKLTALSLFKNKSFFEYGQTLFGCIEGIQFCRELLRNLSTCVEETNLEEVQWYGFDISSFFNEMACLMHSKYSVHTSAETSLIHEGSQVFFAKGVTLLYALRSGEDFFNLANNSQLGLFDYSLSPKESRDSTIGTGKSVCFIGLEEFLEHYRRSSHTIYIRANPRPERDEGKIYFEGIFGGEQRCVEFIERDRYMRSLLHTKYPELTKTLLANKNKSYCQWQEFEDFISGLKL